MIFWTLAALLALAVVAGVLWPLLRGGMAARTAADYDLEVYRDQLAEVERNQAEGLIGDSEAEAARAEIGRRILAADRARRGHGGATGAAGRWLRRAAVGVVAVAVPAGAFAVYLQLGAPGREAVPFAAREDVRGGAQVAGQGGDGAASPGMPDLEQAVAQLKQRLEESPADVEGWLLLGRTQLQRQRYDAAVEAFAKARELRPDNARIAAFHGEALVMASGGTVTPEAQRAFEAAAKQIPEDPQVNFYRGLAALQQGAPEEALDRWTGMVARADPEAPWLDAVKRQMAEAERELDIAPGSTFAEVAPEGGEDGTDGAPAGPTREQMRAAQDMAPEERRAMIEGMVGQLAARLEDNPDDLQGWLRLARSYTVLEKPEKARKALARAVELAPENVEVLSRYARALRDAAGRRQTPESVEVSRRILELDPKNPEALWFVALHHASEGRRDKARALFDKALAQLPDSPQTEELRRRAEELVGAE